MSKTLLGLKKFLSRQSKNYRILLLTQTGQSLINGLTSQYLVLYQKFIGASTTDIGLLGSLNSTFNAIMSMPSGWLIDRVNLKRLLGLALCVADISMFIYAIAYDWKMLIPAIIISALFGSYGSQILAGGNLLTSVSNVYTANSLKDEDRARGFGISYVLNMVGGLFMPLIAAYLITSFGGLSAIGIRPLFFISVIVGIPFTILIYVSLDKEVKTHSFSKTTPFSFFSDYKDVFKGEKYLKRLILSTCIRNFTMSMCFSFISLYMYEKQATPFIFGISGLIRTVFALVFTLPVSQLADKIGRKNTILVLRPLMYIEWLSLVLAPSPEWLLIHAAMTGFPYEIFLWNTFTIEFVSPEKRGRWNGLLNLFNGTVSIFAPIIGAWIYQFNSWIIFIIPVIADLLIRMPILIQLPDTLKKMKSEESVK